VPRKPFIGKNAKDQSPLKNQRDGENAAMGAVQTTDL
jgi:hypothetical protein